MKRIRYKVLISNSDRCVENGEVEVEVNATHKDVLDEIKYYIKSNQQLTSGTKYDIHIIEPYEQ